jgi:PAS domain S-box
MEKCSSTPNQDTMPLSSLLPTNDNQLKANLRNESFHRLNFLTTLSKLVTGQANNSDMTAIEYAEVLHNYYESIIACMPNNVYWLDRNCVLLGGNDNLAHMFGLKSRAELIGLTYEEMAKFANWTKGQGEVFKQAEIEVMTTGIPRFNVEEPAVIIDGKTRYYMSSKVPLYNMKREIIGVVGISTDITDRKQAEVALKEAKEKEVADKAKTEFLENMRHDIRTPLIGITGFASIIRDEVRDPKIKEYADNLIASSNALLDLMNGILELIQVNSGEIPLVKKKFDLKKRLNDVVQLNQAKARQKHIDLMFNYDEKIPPYVIGDPTRIHRIVLELITNALNFTDTGSVKLTAQLSEINKRELIIKIMVEDTGNGIALDKQQEIFLQFKRLTPSYKGIHKGSGLGLAIVKQFLGELEGEIYVESKVGSGTKFTCILPLKKALINEAFGSDDILTENASKIYEPISKIPIPESISCKEAQSATSKVLLVEDQAIAAMIVKHLLFCLDCQVDVAPDGKTAVQFAQENTYDLIFMDIGLPDVDGYEVTRRIRLYELNKDTHVPIIALTAHVDEENKQRCFQVGMNAILSKPLVKEKAEDILNAFIPCRKQHEQATKLELAQEIPISTIEGMFVDFEEAKQQLGKEEMVHELLNMLIDSFPKEIKQLETAYKNADWEVIRAIAHKLKGGSSYCGAKRLQTVCGKLETVIKNNEMDLVDECYKQLLIETKAVEEVVKNKSYLS